MSAFEIHALTQPEVYWQFRFGAAEKGPTEKGETSCIAARTLLCSAKELPPWLSFTTSRSPSLTLVIGPQTEEIAGFFPPSMGIPPYWVFFALGLEDI